MMMSPETYLTKIQTYAYEDLVSERESLIESIHDLELLIEESEGTEDNFEPAPHARLMANLSYLSALSQHMSSKVHTWCPEEIEGSETIFSFEKGPLGVRVTK